jgi:hypothetical protein
VGGDGKSTAETPNPSRGNRLLCSRVSSAVAHGFAVGLVPHGDDGRPIGGSQSLERESTPLKLTSLCRHRCAWARRRRGKGGWCHVAVIASQLQMISIPREGIDSSAVDFPLLSSLHMGPQGLVPRGGNNRPTTEDLNPWRDEE